MHATYQTSNPLPHGPRFRFPPIKAKRRPRIGLALSGGGAKAAAHIGALHALTRAGVKFDMVAGTSAGALVGLFYCDGHDPENMSYVMQKELAGAWWWRWLPLGNFWRLSRLLRGGGLEALIERNVSARTFDELRTPFYATSTDLVRGEAVIHEDGAVGRAVLASMSLPGLTPPLPDGDRLLADGGLLTYLPSEILRQRGADVIIGVDLSGDAGEPTESGGAFSVLRRAWELQNRVLFREQMAATDVLIRPQLAGFGVADLSRMHLCYERGQEAGAAAVQRIRSLIGARL